MFAPRYFAPRYFAPRYWSPGVAAAIFTSSGRVRAGTTWNPEWAKNYGPDVDRARKAKRKEVNTVLSNSFGFGGTNATLIFTKAR